VTATYASVSTKLPAARRLPAAGRWSEPPSSRLASLVVVAVFHAVLIAALVNALAYRTVPQALDPLKVRVFDEVKARQDDVKPPPPKLDLPPPAFVPLPEVAVAVTPTTTAIAAVTANRPAPPAPSPVAAVRVPPALDSEHSSDPAYPPISRRMSEEGLVQLLVLVGPDGAVMDVKVERTSGYIRLDQAAVEGARTRCRFKPGSVDGKPESMWYRYRYEFKLT